jgi:hypothetical protein
MLVQFDANQVKALKDFWLRKRYLIIDEVSMKGASFFNYISAAMILYQYDPPLGSTDEKKRVVAFQYWGSRCRAQTWFLNSEIFLF